MSNNSACPRGVIYNQEDSKSVYILHKGVTAYKAHFYGKKVEFFNRKDSVDFLVDYVMTQDVRDVLPRNDYVLEFGECKGDLTQQ